MSLPNEINPQLLASSAGYTIDNSLRFRSSASAYLSRTTGSGNTQKWTWSGWVKKGAILVSGSNQFLFSTLSSLTDVIDIDDLADGSCHITVSLNSSNVLVTTPSYRDPSSWYHIVVAVDTTQATAANRVILYVNGVQVTAFSTANYPAQNANTQTNANGSTANIGRRPNASNYFDGYMAELNFIDGQALTPSSFGETNASTGVWQPKAYSGSYGTNGFYLKFSDIATTRDRKSTRLNSSHTDISRMPSSA